MKELTIEEKAKAYDKVLINARMFYKDDHVSDDVNNLLEVLFPELKESEDERIREKLVELVRDTTGDSLWVDYNVHKEDALAWLEKQGKKGARYKYTEELLEADAIYQMAMNDAMVEEAKNKAIGALSKLEISKLLGLEKQGEQKLTNSYCQEHCKGFQETGKCFADGDCKAKTIAETIDKVEPEFREGEQCN